MTVHRFTDARGFCRRAYEFLMRDEASHNLMLGLCTALADCALPARPATYLATVEAAGQVLGAAVRTPPYNVILSYMPPYAAAHLARDMHTTREPLPGVHGPTPQAETFARAWTALTGQASTVRRRMRAYQLDAVAPALRAPGALHRATLGDRDLAARWFQDFTREALEEEPPDDHIALIEQRIRDGIVYLWLHEGRPVSMACSGGTTPSGVRISGVYTPPDCRGRGYASACVAALSQHLLDSGRRHCFLYTDLDNPTANRLYAAIGYRPVCDVKDISF